MTIVLGTTLRPEAHELGDVAGALAQRLQEALRLVHVCEDPRASIVLGTDEEGLLGNVRGRLSEEAKRIESATGATVLPHLAAGDVTEALASVAELELATLLLIGASQRPRRLLQRDLAASVSRATKVPVIALRAPDSFTRWLQTGQPLRVLVGVNLGRTSAAARAFASKLAAVGACDLHVVCVVSPAEAHARLGLAPPADEHAVSSEAEALLSQELARATPREEGSATLRVVSGRGSPDAHLVALADHENFDLVVVGQRRRAALDPGWLRSVARGVLDAAPTNVACVPRPLGEVTPQVEPPRVVVVGTDFEAVSRRAVLQAAAVLAPEGTLHVAHVVSPSATERDLRTLRDDAWHRLSREGSGEPTNGSNPAQYHVLDGEPAEQLLALAHRVGADLLVLGVKRRSTLTRLVVGSVAHALLETARIPLLLVPEQEG